MPTPVFRIKDLSCSYSLSKDDTVLHIQDLEIPSGELIFLLGASGFGKSTLLESLALMNNTIAGGDIEFIAEDGTTTSYKEIYHHNDLYKISEVRKKHFSFIFQNTNLMENFTAYENICLPRMIQQNVTQQAVMDDATILMNKVGLSQTDVGFDTLSVNLSGGQRQRVAFVRALNSQFNVLFGDEPTGNLDESNANELMNLINSSIDKKHTAIIVSHDITLALNHASRIICITKAPGKDNGEILPENIFLREGWQKKSTDELLQFKEQIRELYNSGIKHSDKEVVPVTVPPKTNHNKNFLNLFLKKEGKALAGKYWVNMVIMTLLLFFTFLTLGFANGSIDYLNSKMGNAFVRWIPVNIPMSRGIDVQAIDEIKESLNKNDSLKAAYQYKLVTTFSEQYLYFLNRKNEIIPTKGRSIETDDPILTDILDRKNILKGDVSGFRNAQDLSLIVSRRFLDDLGYDLDQDFVQMEVPVFDTATETFVYDTVSIGIRNVVEELPGKYQFSYTDYFQRSFDQKFNGPFDIKRPRVLRLFVSDSLLSINISKAAEVFLTNNKKYAAYAPEVDPPQRNNDTYHKAFNVDVKFSPLPTSYLTVDSIYNDITHLPAIQPHLNAVKRIYDYYRGNEPFKLSEGNDVDVMSINFNTLDKVRDFNNYARTNFNEPDQKKGGNVIELDVANVREKENFNFLHNVTNITSWLLILFGVVSTSLFILNLLKMHLSKVKMNIGTFTAFGLANSKVQLIYFLIMLRFIIVSIIFGLLLAFGAGYLLNLLLPSVLVVEKGTTYFKLLDPATFIAVGAILVCIIVVSYITIRNMLYKSPGDLIYNR